MTEVDILMISGLLGYTVQRAILEPCHGDRQRYTVAAIRNWTQSVMSNQCSSFHASWCDADLCHIFECW